MQKILYGIDSSEYRHQADIAAQNLVEKAVPLAKIGEVLEEFEHKYQDEIIFRGSHVKLNHHNAPEVMAIWDKAMEIMDTYADVEIFSHRNYSYRMSVGGIKKPFISIPDTIIRNFSETQWLFLFGQMLTMINGRMLKLFAIARNFEKFMSLFPVIGDALKAPLGQWRRKSQLTIDRGGLLCCQDYDCAMRYLTILSGISPSSVSSVDLSARMQQLVDAQSESKETAVAIGHFNQTLFSSRSAWSNERFIELYNWHESGEYAKIIRKHT